MSVGRSGRVLLLAWMVSLVGLLAISMRFSGESTRFSGIADDQEQTIRFTSAVEIGRYGFVSGQEVEPGDLIVEVRQIELDTQLQLIEEKIQALKFGNRESRASMQAAIIQLQADLEGSSAELDSQIHKLRARQEMTKELLVDLEETDRQRGERPIQQEIESLQTRKWANQRAANSKIDDLKSRLATSERPVDAQIAELQKQREDLERQRSELKVYAELSGRVGSVLFKIGETVPPYQPVVTIHGSSPSFVKGYIHESVLNGVQLKQQVWVRPASTMRAEQWHPGTVESLGSRIVEFPDRLKVNPLAQAWGREVVIRLSADHSLLLGEKVDVQLEPPVSRLQVIKTAFAGIGE